MSGNEVLSANSANGKIKEQTFERCEACHRRLKDPGSKRIGMGPVCRKRHAADLQNPREA